jgi:hypothetical protein
VTQEATSATTGASDTARSVGDRMIPRWRRALVVTFLVLGCVVAPISLLAVWVHNTLLNTSQYVDTVAPLASNRVIIDRVATVATEQLFRSVDIEQTVLEVLPPKAAPIAPAIAQQVEQLVHQVALQFLGSSQFRTAWTQANQHAHAQVVALLTGGGGSVRTNHGQVLLQLGSIGQKVRNKLQSLGLTIFPGDKAQPSQIVLFESQGLAAVHGAVNALDTLATVLPILTALALALAVALSPNRRRALVHAGLGVALAMIALLAVLAVTRSIYLGAFTPASRDAGGAAYDQLLTFLWMSARALFTAAAITAFGAWVAGPGHIATRVRGFARRLVTTASDRADAAGSDRSSIARVVGPYRSPLRVLIIGAGGVVLVIMSRPSGITVLVIALVVLLGVAIVEFLARAAPKTPESTRT